MTKSLEEEFNLPPIEDIADSKEEIENPKKTLKQSKTEIAVNTKTMDVVERVDAALPMVQGFDQIEREMDEYANKAMTTFDDLVSLGKNVEDRHAAPIFDSAAKMISAALQAKQGKLDKKLKMLELQMRKAKIDQDQEKIDISKGVDSDPEALEGRIVGDRTSMLEDIMKKINENDK
jgi:hypothetical protein|tara:strand:- start:883 stop:1413 length:531 start_codon:yes stop_codon:yes gene_type:complete